MTKSKKIIIISIVLILILVLSEIFIYMYINNVNIELRKFQNSERYSSESAAGLGSVFSIIILYGLMMWDAIIIGIVLLLIWVTYAIIYYIKKEKIKKIIRIKL